MRYKFVNFGSERIPGSPNWWGRIDCERTRDVKRFRGGLVFKAQRLWYHSTLGLTVIKKKKKKKGTPGGKSVLGVCRPGNPYRGTSLIRNRRPP